MGSFVHLYTTLQSYGKTTNLKTTNGVAVAVQTTYRGLYKCMSHSMLQSKEPCVTVNYYIKNSVIKIHYWYHTRSPIFP